MLFNIKPKEDKTKEGQVLLLANCRYLYSIISFIVDNNLIVYTKLERWLHYFKYNLYGIIMNRFN